MCGIVLVRVVLHLKNRVRFKNVGENIKDVNHVADKNIVIEDIVVFNENTVVNSKNLNN